MAASQNDKFMYVGSPGTATTLSSPGYITGVSTSITVGTTASFSTLTGQIFAIDTVEVVTTNGVAEEVQVAGTYTVYSGTVTNGTTIGNVTLLYGTAQSYAAGALTRVYIPVSSLHTERLIQGLLAEHNQLDGTHKGITTDTITATTGTFTNLVVGSQTPTADWTTLGSTPATVTNNGQRSYSMVFNGTDLTGTVNPGTRIRTTRTVAAPTQSTLLGGTKYWVKTSPNKLTFTDDFTVSAWVKLSSYASGVIASRYNGTSGWDLELNASGQVYLVGWNGGASNASLVNTYQSLPLNKWVHITAQLDMSAFTATTTTSYVMFDGVDIPASVSRSGSNPTALIQAGNLEIGSRNGGTTLFPGKIAQVAVFNSKITQATMLTYISQGLSGTETNLVSAYSFNGVATDLNTTTPNDLTAMNSAGYTADSPFGTQASGLISSTLDYGIVQSCTFSTDTTMVVQVPEGCTIPTSGGVSAVSYSSVAVPYGFPKDKNKWTIASSIPAGPVTPTTANAWNGGTKYSIAVPLGNWSAEYSTDYYTDVGAAGTREHYVTLSTSSTTETITSMTTRSRVSSLAANALLTSMHRQRGFIDTTALTSFYLLFKEVGTINNNSTDTSTTITFENSLL